MTNKEYGQYVNAKSKPSPLWKNLIWAFVTGGLICTLGQGFLNLFRWCGMSETAAANAENNHNMDKNSLYVAECFVTPGPTLKRIRPRAKGSASRINKRTCHITIVVAPREEA